MEEKSDISVYLDKPFREKATFKGSPKLRENLASRLIHSESKLNSDQYGKFVSGNLNLSVFKRSKEQWLASFDKEKKTKELFRYS